jgi:RNA polymerase sigma-70 factor (ECF subfamily)
VKTWLFTTLYRAFLMAKRRQHRFPHTELDNETAENLSATCPETGAQADARQVLPALALVDKVYQAAVALYYLDDCSYKEIAAILEVPVGTVKSRIARGIAQLREILLSDEPARSDSSGNRTVSPQQTRREFREAACLPDRCNQNGRARIHDDGAGRDYKKWDYSATILPELLGFE